MVEMLMGVHHEADRLAGNKSDDFLDHRQAALLVERRFDYDDVILELDRDAVMGRAAQKIDTGGQLLRFNDSLL